MNDFKKRQISEFAEREFDARMTCERFAMQNQRHDYEEAKQQAIEYALAKALWAIAKQNLEEAMKP